LTSVEITLTLRLFNLGRNSSCVSGIHINISKGIIELEFIELIVLTIDSKPNVAITTEIEGRTVKSLSLVILKILFNFHNVR